MKIDLALGFVFLVLFSSCTHKNTSEDITKFSSQFVHDAFPYEGKYVWAFNLMSSEQVSTHTLYPDSITCTMTGKVYATDYTMKKLSFDKSNNKWIGIDENNIVYALFFKDKTDSTITIYKHKCKSNGLEEALSFAQPAPNATDDHGWNTYGLNGYQLQDVLTMKGRYIHKGNTVDISDQSVTIDGNRAEKISFHTGERRWVGKAGEEYVQLFFKNINDTKHPELSITWSSDPQELYSTKYNSITNWQVYDRL